GPGRPRGRLLPEEAGTAVRDPRRERAHRRLLADAHLELAPAVYPGAVRRTAGLVVSGVRLVVSHRARDGRLPRGLRGAIRSSCANRYGGDSPCEGWRPVQSRVRRAPVRG